MEPNLEHLHKPGAEPTTFVDDCLKGIASADDIDDYVDFWHTAVSYPRQSLQAFLGFSESEYAAWLCAPKSVEQILAERQQRPSA